MYIFAFAPNAEHRRVEMFLDYFALGVLFFVVITMFYAIIGIHDVPYDIARRRQHPHQDAIHAAGWVSLFTLHALRSFLWIWAMAYRPERGWGFSDQPPGQSAEEFREALARLEARIAALERPASGKPR
jgi:hypothetical protein